MNTMRGMAVAVATAALLAGCASAAEPSAGSAAPSTSASTSASSTSADPTTPAPTTSSAEPSPTRTDGTICQMVNMMGPPSTDGLGDASTADDAHEWGLYFEEMQAYLEGNLDLYEAAVAEEVGRLQRDEQLSLDGVNAVIAVSKKGAKVFAAIEEPVTAEDRDRIAAVITDYVAGLHAICPSMAE